eukprot:Sspe_Gene.98618::Locus_72018_Transcript_1_1_Confidence_1.000_Length_1585::g.98618::m.98618
MAMRRRMVQVEGDDHSASRRNLAERRRRRVDTHAEHNKRMAAEVMASSTQLGILRVWFQRLLAYAHHEPLQPRTQSVCEVEFDQLKLDPVVSPIEKKGKAKIGQRRAADQKAPGFSRAVRIILPLIRGAQEVCPALARLLKGDAPLFGVFSLVEPAEWSQLSAMLRGYPVVTAFLKELSKSIDKVYPASIFEIVSATTPPPRKVEAKLYAVLPVVLQLCSFYITFSNNTNRTYTRFTSRFATGGFIPFGQSMLSALAIATATDYDQFVASSKTACHMALALGEVVERQMAMLPKPPKGQSYVMHVHNISFPCLERLLQKVNLRENARSVVVISCVLASRSFFLTGHPEDLTTFRTLLHSLTERGFKFGTRFMDFPGPLLTPFYNQQLATDVLELWRQRKTLFHASELCWEIFSPVNGTKLRDCGERLMSEVASILTTQPHSSTQQHHYLPFKAAVVSFETQANPTQLGGHNLVASQLLLQTPYIQCVSQPYSFVHTRPSMEALHPRNNTLM